MTTEIIDGLDLHGERAALRGNPSFVWRAGQDRRLNMILAWSLPDDVAKYERVLVDGCGVGMYVKALQPYSDEIYGLDIEAEHLRHAVKNVDDAGFQLAACEHPTDRVEHVPDDAEC